MPGESRASGAKVYVPMLQGSGSRSLELSDLRVLRALSVM